MAHVISHPQVKLQELRSEVAVQRTWGAFLTGLEYCARAKLIASSIVEAAHEAESLELLNGDSERINNFLYSNEFELVSIEEGVEPKISKINPFKQLLIEADMEANEFSFDKKCIAEGIAFPPGTLVDRHDEDEAHNIERPSQVIERWITNQLGIQTGPGIGLGVIKLDQSALVRLQGILDKASLQEQAAYIDFLCIKEKEANCIASAMSNVLQSKEGFSWAGAICAHVSHYRKNLKNTEDLLKVIVCLPIAGTDVYSKANKQYRREILHSLSPSWNQNFKSLPKLSWQALLSLFNNHPDCFEWIDDSDVARAISESLADYFLVHAGESVSLPLPVGMKIAESLMHAGYDSYIPYEECPLPICLLLGAEAGAFGHRLHWSDNVEPLDRLNAYESVISRAVEEGHYKLAASLFIIFLRLGIYLDGRVPTTKQFGHLMKLMRDMPPRIMAYIGEELSKVCRLLSPADRLNEMLGALIPSDAPGHYLIQNDRDYSEKAEAARRMYKVLGADMYKLSARSIRILEEAEMKWSRFSADLGTGAFKEWGNIAVEFYKVIEHELQIRCKPLDPILRRTSNGDGNFTAGQYVRFLIDLSDGKFDDEILTQLAPIKMPMKLDKRLLAELRKAGFVRNSGFHPGTFGEKEAFEFRNQMLNSEDGIMKRFCELLNE